MTYFVDKFMMLRLCVTPPNYGKDLEKTMRFIGFLAIPCHCVLAIYMLGSPKMFSGTMVRIFRKKFMN